ncbi:MAG TPA: L-histidine N(alpha)-methyltransferase [Cytophagales bacterium]|nr:L-histidine N(alpha)-methyltransferase [Cytophagales bacterium]HAA21977.1 L-histidine N(alpha)-methyltransferase [Cytophagales bacterium]HAP61327.1 L-histidine N(alpha)-methyltransferase [Cytophagales bacterium]
MDQILTANEVFARDVSNGLENKPKFLSSKYFYNERGDQLFQKIMELEEYYLTRAEYAIFERHKEHLHQLASPNGEAFRLVEFGAGDGYKTKVLLRHLVEQKANFTYQPIDISSHVLEELETALDTELPGCSVDSVCADYFEAIAEISARDTTRKMVFFLGSNIGNFYDEQAQDFLRQLHSHLHSGDRVLIGFDQQKDPKRILAAYNDREGVTREFNLNLLDRINEELGGNFDREQFTHWPTYDPQTGECKSYLLSKKAQVVYLEAVDRTFHFDAWEPIYMEMSRKFNRRQMEQLAKVCGFKVLEHLTDPAGDFVDSVWERL